MKLLRCTLFVYPVPMQAKLFYSYNITVPPSI
jgi:hypothetical protein